MLPKLFLIAYRTLPSRKKITFVSKLDLEFEKKISLTLFQNMQFVKIVIFGAKIQILLTSVLYIESIIFGKVKIQTTISVIFSKNYLLI